MTDKLFDEYRKVLDKLNLKTADDLENLVKPLIKEATQIILNQSSKKPKETSLLSHFGGQPYFEKGEKWPKSQGGNCLEFVFQIFNTGNINIPNNIKLLQFYYDFEECPCETSDDGWLVKTYENIDKDNFTIIEKPKEHEIVQYCEINYQAIKSLPIWNGIESCDKNVKMLSCVLNGEKPWEYYLKVVEKLIGEQGMKCKTYHIPTVDPLSSSDNFSIFWKVIRFFSALRYKSSSDNFSVIWKECQSFENKISQLGGHAQWLQNDDSPSNNDFQLLFQLASEDDARLLWEDVGMIYIFYNPIDKEFEFVLQCH